MPEASKIKIFATGLEEGRTDERLEWIAAGHGDHCFSPTAVLAESGVQTETEPVSMNTCTQPNIESTPVTTSAPHVEIQANVSRSTADSAVQTTPLGTQDTGSQTSLQPVPTLTPLI